MPDGRLGKFCSGCDTTKVTDDFTRDRQRPTGLYPICRTCMADRRQIGKTPIPTPTEPGPIESIDPAALVNDVPYVPTRITFDVGRLQVNEDNRTEVLALDPKELAILKPILDALRAK